MKQYPADFRDRLLRALDAGLEQAEAARTFGVADRTIRRWRQRRRESGGAAPKPRVGRRRRIGAGDEPALRAQAAVHPDATLDEHCARWAAARGDRVSPATMSRALARLGLPLKKSPSSPPNATRPRGKRGAPRSRPSTRRGWSSSTKRPRPRA
jgi:transposase